MSSVGCSKACAVLAMLLCLSGLGRTQQFVTESLNRPERIEWFRDQGFGIFIHWSVDSQLGTVISHSLVDASPQYAERFYQELPKTFFPERYDADAMARLVKLSGARYAMFTTKHHSGFCMFRTATTEFGVAGTPFQRDITRELYDSLRRQGVGVGVYFSPDDFHWLYEQKIAINRSVPSVQFAANPGLLQYDRQQLRELMTQYGKVDLVFFDGEAQGLRDLAWELQPETVVTRGALETPEQYVPGAPLKGAWESNMTMGTAWGYQPQHEVYKSGPELIRALIQTRARGGNFLLNVGPKPDGQLPIEQEERLREIGLWMFVNGEAIYGVRSWTITNEGDIWFTRKGNDVFAIVDKQWRRGEALDFVLKSVRATANTKIEVLGQQSEVYEYRPEAKTRPHLSQEADGLHVHAFRTQRLQDSGSWPNAAVLRLTNVEEAFTPPVVHTLSVERTKDGVILRAEWESPAKTEEKVAVGFQYREITDEDKNSRTAAWKDLGEPEAVKSPGPFQRVSHGVLQTDRIYEVRAVLRHPLLTIYGEERRLDAAGTRY